MSQLGESVIQPQPEEPEEEEEVVERVKVRISLFFDGTLNNRINIDQRIEDEKDPGTNEIYQKYKKDDNSYEGDYTNVAKMEKNIDISEGYQVTLSSYNEGPGTEDKKGDTFRGYAFGTGKTGVTNKVEKGLLNAVDKIVQNVEQASIIELLTIDVFGFSRGAAGARNCIYEALNSGKDPIKARIEAKNRDIKKVEVCFAGLYDTVASHGIVYSNDTSDLKLTAINRAKRVVQLAAAEEHRKNFNLTSIESAGRKGLQLFLPGVHSDVGGGYRSPSPTKPSENDMGVYRSSRKSKAEKERTRLIESGWYREGEIKMVTRRSPKSGLIQSYVLEVSREKISNEYSRVPLHIMVRYARENGVGINTDFDRVEKIIPDLNATKQKIDEYILKISNNSKASDWSHNVEWLSNLRHDYLHFSAHLSLAHAPRIKNNIRTRKAYYG